MVGGRQDTGTYLVQIAKGFLGSVLEQAPAGLIPLQLEGGTRAPLLDPYLPGAASAVVHAAAGADAAASEA